MALGDRRPAQLFVGLAEVEEYLALADLRAAYDAGGGGFDGEAGGGDVAELLVLVRQGAALDLAVQGGTADPRREVAPVLAGGDRAGGTVRAGGGDVETGGDESVPGLDDAGVTVRGTGFDDHDGLGRGGRRVHEGGSVGDGEFVEDVGDGDEVGGVEGERRADPCAAPTGVAQCRVGGGDLFPQGECGFGPVEYGHRAVAVPGGGDGPGRGAGATADVHVSLRGPLGYGVREGVQCGTYGLESHAASDTPRRRRHPRGL